VPQPEVVTQKIEKTVEEEKTYMPNVRSRAKKSVPLEPLPPLRQTKK
jgi:hypothetical protein